MCECTGSKYQYVPEPLELEERPPVSRKIDLIKPPKQAVTRAEPVLVPVNDTFVSESEFRGRLWKRMNRNTEPNKYTTFIRGKS